MTEVHSICVHNNWIANVAEKGEEQYQRQVRDGSHRQDEAPFCVLSVFLLCLQVVFCLIGGFLFLILRPFHLSNLKVQGQIRLLAVPAHSLPRQCSTLLQVPLVMPCPEPLPCQPLILMGVVSRHQMVTHKSVNHSWPSRARGLLFGERLSILEEPEQAEGIVRD